VRQRAPRLRRRVARTGAALAAVVLGLAVAPAGAGDGAAPSPLGSCGPIERTHEVVELRGMRLRRLAGTPLDRIGMVAWRAGRAQPIPFQVDERIGTRIAMPGGPAPEADDHPGVLDADDALLFMACDAGARAPAGTPPRADGREIRIDDPRTGATAWAYLVLSDAPPRTDRRYVRYDPARDTVTTARWSIGCVDALPSYFALGLTGPLGPNVVDGLRLRANAVLRANLARWSLTERDGRNGLVAWTAGPIRVVRRSKHEVEIGLGIHLSAGLLHTAFYGEHVLAPGSLKLPFSPSVFFREITALGGVDLRGMEGWRYLAPGVPAGGLAVDGRMDERERAYAGRGRWFALVRGDEAIAVAITMSEELERALPLDLVYVDDATRAAPPEIAPGSVPFVGVRAREVERLPGGRYRFQLRVFAVPGWRAGAEQALLAQVDVPLTAEVSIPPDLEPRRRPTQDPGDGAPAAQPR